jgi:hypothetical protein
MPFGVYDIYNQKHLLESLAQLILKHVDVQKWIFKIDDYFDGLGIAYCDIAMHLPCYKNLFNEAERSEQVEKELFINFNRNSTKRYIALHSLHIDLKFNIFIFF